MDETFVIVGPDGTEHEFPVGMDPKRAAAIVRGDVGKAPVEQAKPAVPENLGFLGSIQHALATADPMGRGVVPVMSADPDVAQQQAADTMGSWATTVLPMVATGGVLGGAARYGPTALRGALSTGAKVMDNPLGGLAVGAATGGVAGGWNGAIQGGMAGLLGGSRVSRALRKLSKAAPPAAAAPVAQAASTPTAKSLADEVTKRIDWRITDAVPIDAIKRDLSRGGSIIEAGESQVGLAERMAAAMKAKNIEEAARLAAAIRQRGHITARTTR